MTAEEWDRRAQDRADTHCRGAEFTGVIEDVVTGDYSYWLGGKRLGWAADTATGWQELQEASLREKATAWQR